MSLMEMARCMVKSQQLPHAFWLEAVMCATYILNRCPTKALQSITPYEAWHGKKPSIGQLACIWLLGLCFSAYATTPQELDDKAVKCIFVGYSAESKGYRLYHPQPKRILISRDVVFVEDVVQPCYHVPKRQVLAHGMYLIHCCLSLQVEVHMYLLLRHMFSLCRF